MKQISVKVDLVELYNDRVLTDEMLVGLLFGDGIGEHDEITPDDNWKKNPPEPSGFEALLAAYKETLCDDATQEMFAAIRKWLHHYTYGT